MARDAQVIINVSWVGILPYIMAALEHGTPDGKRLAREELHRMADAADMAVQATAELERREAAEVAEAEAEADRLLAEGEARADASYDRDPDGYQAGQIGSTGDPALDALALRMERGETGEG